MAKLDRFEPKRETPRLHSRTEKQSIKENFSGKIEKSELVLKNEKFQKNAINWLALVLTLRIFGEENPIKITMFYMPCRIVELNGKSFGEVEITAKYVRLLIELGYLTTADDVVNCGSFKILNDMITEVESFAGKQIKVTKEVTTTIETKITFGEF